MAEKMTSKLMLSFILANLLTMILVVDIPKSLSFVPGIIGLLFYVLYSKRNGAALTVSRDTAILCGIILVVASASLLWAAHFDTSLKQVKKLFLLLPPQILLLSVVSALPAENIAAYKKHIQYGFAAACFLLLFEIMSGGIIFNLTRGADLSIPADPDEMNRGAVALCLYLFALLPFYRENGRFSIKILLPLVPLCAALALTSSQSAQASLILGVMTLFLFPYKCHVSWKITKYSILALMISAPFFVPPIYDMAIGNVEHYAFLREAYAGHRLEIWDFISRYIYSSPWIGYGIEVTRAVTDFDSRMIYAQQNTILYPHNFSLQIWIEFGLLGTSIASGLMYILLSRIEQNYSHEQQKTILPVFILALLSCAVAYGLWQGWWLGTLFHIAAMTIMSVKISQSEET